MRSPIKKNLNNPEDKGFYITKMFSENGYNCLLNYMKYLVKEYNTRKRYPFKQPIILGIPQMVYAQKIESPEALYERIKAYAMILGIYEINIEIDNSTITYKIK